MPPRWLVLCLLLVPSFGIANAQAVHIVLAGAKNTADCAGPLTTLQHELEDLQYPPGWTIYVACNPIVWTELRTRADNPPTDTAFTDLKLRYTVLNGAIFQGLPNEYRQTLAHELGHILCSCKDEADAGSRAEALLRPRQPRPSPVILLARGGSLDDDALLTKHVSAFH